jgi:MoaA/NifB/PqqE/SkfB family radical SAM enzyme
MNYKNSSWKTLYPKFLHVELSTFCNAACPLCPRFYESTDVVRPDINLTQITLDKFKQYFPEEYLRQTDRILFCGTMGDPIMAKDCFKIFQHIWQVKKNCWQVVHTNGGTRDTTFWTDMGKLFHHENMSVVFSIDGLEDTNHIYRRKVDWNTLMDNVQTFINAGGNAVWDYLVFGHNEHQIEEARELSKKLGFTEFRVKRAIGFENHVYNALIPKPVFDKNGILQYKLFPSSLLEYQNSTVPIELVDRTFDNMDLAELYEAKELKYFPSVKKKIDQFKNEQSDQLGQYESELNNREIKCNSHFSDYSEVYVNAEGIMFPCCFVGTRFDGYYAQFIDIQLKSKIGNRISELDLNLRNITEIIESGVLDEIFTDSWKKESIRDGKMAMCSETCGNSRLMSRLHVNEL